MSSRLEDVREKVLLLGMVYSEETRPHRGQEYRDRVRCEALEKIGYKTYSLDDKHNGDKLSSGRHCMANFADSRRMLKMMKSSWGEDTEFDYIILDYFFSPEGWARTRWTDAFYKNTLPMLVTADILKPNGSIYLPNLECVEELLHCYEKSLSEHYIWDHVSRPKDNPLYRATDKVTDDLLKCPDMLTNESQMQPLNNFSDTPFIILKRLNRSYLKRDASGEVIRRAASKYHPLVGAESSPRKTESCGSLTDTEGNSVSSSPVSESKRKKMTSRNNEIKRLVHHLSG